MAPLNPSMFFTELFDGILLSQLGFKSLQIFVGKSQVSMIGMCSTLSLAT